MIHFKLILFFCVFSLNLQAQNGDEYDANEYDCNEYEAFCSIEKKTNPLSIFPNPTSDYFEVKNAVNTEGCLFNAVGRLIRRIDISKTVDVSDLPKSLYIIRVDSEVFKIIKN